MTTLRTALRSGNPRTLFAGFVYFDMSFMVWVLLGALGNFIADDLGLSGTQKGVMTALPVLSGALLRLVLGIAGDRLGGRRVGMFGLAFTLIPLAIGWLFADQISTLYLVGLLLGVAGASFAVALPLVSRWYPPEHQGLVLGIAGAGNSGTVLASLFGPRLAESYGWEAVFGLAMIPIALALVAFVLLARDAPRATAPAPLREYARVATEGDALWFSAFYCVTFGGFVGLASYQAIFLRDEYGMSKVHAGDLTAAAVFMGSFARPVGGLLADRLGGDRVLALLMAAAGVTLLLVATLPPLPIAAALLLITMGLLGLGNGTVFQIVPSRFREEIGIATGLIGAAGGLGGFILPILFGFGREAMGSEATGFIALGFAAMAFAVVLRVRREWCASWTRVPNIAPLPRALAAID